MRKSTFHERFRAADGRIGRNHRVCFEHQHSPEGLQEILQRERCRADRTGNSFCMLLYEPRDYQAPREGLERLAGIARQRIRLTDDLVSIDSRWLAVILSDTDAAAAWTMADDLAARYGSSAFPFAVSVYRYPTDTFPVLEDGAGCTRVADGEEHRPVHSPDVFFVRPLPGWKRAIDVLGAIVGLLVFSPLLVLVALLVKLGSRGPLFFKQRRAGLGGKPFTMYKFRSMRADAEAKKKDLLAFNEQDGPAFKLRNDPRVTPLGRFLRSTSIDELPQFWNVLRGEMSLVGPRPLPCDEAAACCQWQQHRLDVTPGLTCIWQVKGRSRVGFAEWVRMDIQYIRQQCWKFDVELILMTIVAVLRQSGAF